MKRRFFTLVAGVLLAVLAHAEPETQRGMPHRRGEGPMPMQRPQAAASQSMQAQAPASPANGRMSPEERRQLRRDIDAAGRELYRPPPPHPNP